MAPRKVNTSTHNKYGATGSRQRKLNARAGRAPVANARTANDTKTNWDLADEIIFGRRKKK